MYTHGRDLAVRLALWLHLNNVWIVPPTISSHNISGEGKRKKKKSLVRSTVFTLQISGSAGGKLNRRRCRRRRAGNYVHILDLLAPLPPPPLLIRAYESFLASVCFVLSRGRKQRSGVTFISRLRHENKHQQSHLSSFVNREWGGGGGGGCHVCSPAKHDESGCSVESLNGRLRLEIKKFVACGSGSELLNNNRERSQRTHNRFVLQVESPRSGELQKKEFLFLV